MKDAQQDVIEWLRRELTTHKEALEKCEVAVLAFKRYRNQPGGDKCMRPDIYAALAAIAKCKEGHAK